MGNVYEFSKTSREMTVREKAEQEQARQIQELSSVPVPWFKHPANNRNLAQFASDCGSETYGRLWLLAEYVANTDSHAIPTGEERGYKSALRMLGYENSEAGAKQFEDFISTLIDYDIATICESGRRGLSFVDDAARAVGENRYYGSIGGTKARNRRRKALA